MNAVVSIIIPAYNAEKYISDTIDSVLKQTYTSWELIIVNDGSKDKTEEIIRTFLTNPNIRYFSQSNSGVSVARNIGIAQSKGNYIAFLDSDDIWLPDNLEKKMNLLEHNPDIDWVFSDILEADENMQNRKSSPVGRDDNILDNLLLWEGEVVPGPCSNLVLKRKCLETGILFDPVLSTAADQDFCISLATKFRGKRIPEALWVYRVIKNSMSRNIHKMETDHVFVYKKSEKNHLFKSFWFKQRCFSNLYLILAGSWWRNGNGKWRGILFMIRSVWAFPLNIIKLLKKLPLSTYN